MGYLNPVMQLVWKTSAKEPQKFGIDRPQIFPDLPLEIYEKDTSQ